MPGANCSVFGCSTSRKSKGIGIFKLPAPTTDFNKQWRADLVNIVTKDRVVDKALKNQLADNNIHICKKQFREDQIYFYPTRKT